MTIPIKILLWASLGAVAYNYAGYPILFFLLSVLSQAKSDLVFLITRKSRRCLETINFQPSVAIVIAAYNEETVIKARVENALQGTYPSNLLEVLIGLDSSTDSTADVLDSINSRQVRTFRFVQRRGKLAVISDLAQYTSAEILIFTDANTTFEPNCVPCLVRHFVDKRVAVVAGEEIRFSHSVASPSAEELYWKYESALKMLESRMDCLHSASGSIYAIRRD